jgi:hypothetical protein
MESFWGAVKIMLFVYALAAVISMAVAGIIRLIFAGIRMQGTRAAAQAANAKAATAAGNPATERKT